MVVEEHHIAFARRIGSGALAPLAVRIANLLEQVADRFLFLRTDGAKASDERDPEGDGSPHLSISHQKRRTHSRGLLVLLLLFVALRHQSLSAFCLIDLRSQFWCGGSGRL